MKQLLILSGKGGTGKTTVASAFIKLSGAKAYADCDVDAPNLHLVMSEKQEAVHSDYYGLPKASIDQNLCQKCGLCKQNCRFDAIQQNGAFHIDLFSCEGCSLCVEICLAHAITMKAYIAGELKLYSDDHVFSTAQLKMGSGTSGKLVTEVKKQMTSNSQNFDLAIIDGSPGIGCPVIASLSGVDMVLLVTEPSLSGISDMMRIINTAEKFKTEVAVCINKYDTNIPNTERIEAYCRNNGIPFAGKIPFDNHAVTAINLGQSIVDINCAAGYAAKFVFREVMTMLYRNK